MATNWIGVDYGASEGINKGSKGGLGRRTGSRLDIRARSGPSRPGNVPGEVLWGSNRGSTDYP